IFPLNKHTFTSQLRRIDAADVELMVARIDIANERNSVAQVESKPVSHIFSDDARRALRLKCFLLIFRQLHFRIDDKDFLRVDCKTREEILRIASILVSASEPLPRHRLADTRRRENPLEIKSGHGQGNRNAIACRQSQCLRRWSVTKIESVINR